MLGRTLLVALATTHAIYPPFRCDPSSALGLGQASRLESSMAPVVPLVALRVNHGLRLNMVTGPGRPPPYPWARRSPVMSPSSAVARTGHTP